MKKPIQQKRKILRRPMIPRKTTEFGVGLLRMTSWENIGIEAGNRALIQARFLMKGIRGWIGDSEDQNL